MNCICIIKVPNREGVQRPFHSEVFRRPRRRFFRGAWEYLRMPSRWRSAGTGSENCGPCNLPIRARQAATQRSATSCRERAVPAAPCACHPCAVALEPWIIRPETLIDEQQSAQRLIRCCCPSVIWYSCSSHASKSRLPSRAFCLPAADAHAGGLMVRSTR
jgi:hypothetical protein